LETDNGGSGLLRRHPVAAAFGLLFFAFLAFGDDIIFFGSRVSGTALGVPLSNWEIPT
jgi:hypothetical protein